LPTYSFNITIEGDKIVVEINRVTEGDSPDDLSLKLIDPEGEQADFDFVSNSDLKDGKKRVGLNLAYFGTPKAGNYTLIIKISEMKQFIEKKLKSPHQNIVSAFLLLMTRYI